MDASHKIGDSGKPPTACVLRCPVCPTVALLLPLTMRFLAAIVPAQGGRGMIRRLSLITVCGAMGLFAASSGHSANESAFQVGDWVGRAFWNQKDKRLIFFLLFEVVGR